MKQKFRKLTFVKIERTPYVFIDAIIDGSYSQIFGGKGIDSYSIFHIEGGRIINSLAWFNDDQITENKEQDRYKAESMIETYHFR